MLTSGSLFAGYGGLTLAVEDALGAVPAWFSEHEPPSKTTPKPTQAAARVLAHRWPGVPNLGDVRRDWSRVPGVDITDGGYPCQGESPAGKRLGMDDPRWMWPAYFECIRELRPRIAIGENVARHLQASFRWVIADMQSIGYAVTWVVVAASDVGACHERRRLFWLAYDETAGPPSDLVGSPFAALETGRWMVPDLFGAQDVERIPYAGAAYAGAAYAAAAYAGASPSSALLPTARVTDTHGVGLHGQGGLDLRTAVSLLPTPMTTDTKSAAAADLDRKSPGLRAVSELLPAGTVRPDALLATPRVAASRTSRSAALRADSRSSPSLEQCLELASGLVPREFTSADELPPSWASTGALAPTPRATDGSKGGPNQRGSSGDVMLPSAVQPGRWGKYALAVSRQEALTRPAPEPTIIGKRGGAKLNPALVEWMMWMPAGWFTDVPGITVNEALKLGGNGVVRAQGAAAIRHLIARVPASVLAERAA